MNESLLNEDSKKLGEILTQMKFARNTQIREFLREQDRIQLLGENKFKLGQLLMFAGIIDQTQLLAALRLQRASKQIVVAKKNVLLEGARQPFQKSDHLLFMPFFLRKHLERSPVLNFFKILLGRI